MKKLVGKNQIIITVLVLMIVAAGYFNYAEKNIVKSTGVAQKDAKEDELEEQSTQELRETVLTSGKAFSADAKLNREQVRAKNKEALLEIINNASVSEAQKQQAVDAMVAMTNNSEKEEAVEMLLEAKGFGDTVVSISDNSVDIVMDMTNISDEQKAQIEDIVMKKVGTTADNIVFTPLNATAANGEAQEPAAPEESDSGAVPEEQSTQEPGEAVLTSSKAFSADAKLNREQLRAKNKEALLEIINNASVSEAQKQQAVDAMVAMTNNSEKEEAVEMLLEAKGFGDTVVSISDNSVDIVMDMTNISDAQRAQIEDIVMRKAGATADNIVFTPLN